MLSKPLLRTGHTLQLRKSGQASITAPGCREPKTRQAIGAPRTLETGCTPGWPKDNGVGMCNHWTHTTKTSVGQALVMSDGEDAAQRRRLPDTPCMESAVGKRGCAGIANGPIRSAARFDTADPIRNAKVDDYRGDPRVAGETHAA